MSDIFRDFDKKNEVPKVKIPKFATGGICNDAIFFKLDAFSQIDEIVKDIKDRQDNAMAMEFTKCIGELLKKNGVTPKIKQYGCDFYGENSFSSKYGVIIDELDFSEHDKVFEDKIVKLKGEIEYYKDGFYKAEKNCDKLHHENKELKQRISGLEKELEEWKEEARAVKKNRDEQLKNFREAVEPYADIGHMHETIGELKQLIAKLESKETEKLTKINLNDRIKVKLTPLGAEIYYHMFDDTNKKAKKTIIEPHLPKVDEKGYTEFTLWGFINTYGQYIDVGKPDVIDPIDIIACE